MRWVFPQDRLVFGFHAGSPLYPVPAGSPIQIFLDQAGTVLADLQDAAGNPIGDGTLAIGDDSLVPLFFGPDTTEDGEVTKLWAKPMGATETYQLDALTSDRIDHIIASGAVGVTSLNGMTGQVLLTLAQLGGQAASQRGHAGGYAALDDTGVVPGAQLPPSHYTHSQGVPMNVWVVTHNLGFNPNVNVVDTNGHPWVGAVSYVDTNRLQITFTNQPLAGTATCS